MFYEGMKAKATIKKIELVQWRTKQMAKMDVKIEVNHREGEEAFGSDFFEFESVIYQDVQTLSEDTQEGTTYDVIFDGTWWKIDNEPNKKIVNTTNLGQCPPNCKDCKAVRVH